MKKLVAAALALLLTGCAGADRGMEQAVDIRSQVLSTACSFSVEITADYIDAREQFSMDCTWDPEGTLRFQVTEPEEIAGICGSVSGTEGTLDFDDTVLALPLMAQERLSPVSGPWVMMKALASGNLIACDSQEETLHLTLRDSYADDALDAEVWLDGKAPQAAEISWKGRRNLTMEIENFSFVQKSEEAA